MKENARRGMLLVRRWAGGNEEDTRCNSKGSHVAYLPRGPHFSVLELTSDGARCSWIPRSLFDGPAGRFATRCWLKSSREPVVYACQGTFMGRYAKISVMTEEGGLLEIN